MPDVRITRIDQTLPLPQYETPGSFAFDFVVRETTNIPAGEVVGVPSNCIIACPDDLALLVLPRSSLFRKKGLVFPHSIGLIDRDYCGMDDEILLQVWNPGKETITLERGERIAQGLFVQTRQVRFIEGSPHTDSRGGFGSTGGHV